VEVVALALVGGVVAGIGSLGYQASRDRTVAADAVADFDALRRGGLDYLVAPGDWPPPAAAGETPPGLGEFLPVGFSLSRDRYEFGWEHWTLVDGLPRHPEIRALVGISMTTDVPRAAAAVGRALGSGGTWYGPGPRYTFLIDGL
jgi:hypothetical protein